MSVIAEEREFVRLWYDAALEISKMLRTPVLILGMHGTCCAKDDTPSMPAPSASTPPLANAANHSTPMNSIDRLITKLSASPLWTNGIFPTLELPEVTTTERVVQRVFETISFDQGKIAKYAIIEERAVRIGADPREYTAVLVDTNLGRKIALLQWQGEKIGWWSRVFEE